MKRWRILLIFSAKYHVVKSAQKIKMYEKRKKSFALLLPIKTFTNNGMEVWQV